MKPAFRGRFRCFPGAQFRDGDDTVHREDQSGRVAVTGLTKTGELVVRWMQSITRYVPAGRDDAVRVSGGMVRRGGVKGDQETAGWPAARADSRGRRSCHACWCFRCRRRPRGEETSLAGSAAENATSSVGWEVQDPPAEIMEGAEKWCRSLIGVWGMVPMMFSRRNELRRLFHYGGSRWRLLETGPASSQGKRDGRQDGRHLVFLIL